MKKNLFLAILIMCLAQGLSPLIAKESGSDKSKHKKYAHSSHDNCCQEVKKYLQQCIKDELMQVTCLLYEIKKCCKKEKEKVVCSGKPSSYDRYSYCSWRDSHKQCGLSCG